MEVAVGAAIALAFGAGLLSAFSTYTKGALSNTKRIQATYLAEEGAEAVRFLRDQSFTSLRASAPNGAERGIEWNGSWQIVSAPTTIDGIFTRKIVLSEVRRDANGNINAAGSPDPNSFIARVTVTWMDGQVSNERSAVALFTNLASN